MTMPASITPTLDAPPQSTTTTSAPQVPPSPKAGLSDAAAKEPQAPEPEPAKPAEPQVSKAFIEIKRRKREMAEKERIIQRREQDLATKQREYAELKELQAKDPWEFAHRMGFNARDVAKRAVEQSKESPEAAAIAELKKAKADLEAEIKAIKEGLDTKDQESTKAANIRAVQEAISFHAETLPYLGDEAIEDVTQAFDQVYRRDYEPLGIPLTPEHVKAIFEFMESNLRETYEGKVSRIAQKRGPVKPTPPIEKTEPYISRQNLETRSPQLTNLEASQTSHVPGTAPLSTADRKARAIAKLKIIATDD